MVHIWSETSTFLSTTLRVNLYILQLKLLLWNQGRHYYSMKNGRELYISQTAIWKDTQLSAVRNRGAAGPIHRLASAGHLLSESARCSPEEPQTTSRSFSLKDAGTVQMTERSIVLEVAVGFVQSEGFVWQGTSLRPRLLETKENIYMWIQRKSTLWLSSPSHVHFASEYRV